MYWYLLTAFLLILFVLFYVVSQRTPSAPVVEIKTPSPISVPAPEVPNPSEEMLKTFYAPAREKVELDYPPKQIGCCPFSKPASTDLPIGNVPMCYASASQSHLKQI